MECSRNADCILQVKSGEGTTTPGHGECICNYKDGKGYCDYSTAHANFQTQLKALKAYFSKTPTEKYISMAKTTYSYSVRKTIMPLMVKFKGVDQCELDSFIGDDPNPTPIPTSSTFFEASFYVFVFLTLLF